MRDNPLPIQQRPRTKVKAGNVQMSQGRTSLLTFKAFTRAPNIDSCTHVCSAAHQDKRSRYQLVGRSGAPYSYCTATRKHTMPQISPHRPRTQPNVIRHTPST